MTTLTLPAVDGAWSIDDIDVLPREFRYEIHNGKLVIMSPARLWHQETESRIRNLLRAWGRPAYTQVGVRRTRTDTRVCEVGVFQDEPTDSGVTWHDPSTLALVVEVWSTSSDAKDRDPSWHAYCGIGEYWLAEPIEGDTWGALITMHELARSPSGLAAYVETRRTTLNALERGPKT